MRVRSASTPPAAASTAGSPSGRALLPERGAPINGCNFVVGVESDVDGLFQRALDLGATEAVALEDMEGIGRGGYLLDPDGNVFGLMSPVLSDGTVAMGG